MLNRERFEKETGYRITTSYVPEYNIVLDKYARRPDAFNDLLGFDEESVHATGEGSPMYTADAIERHAEVNEHDGQVIVTMWSEYYGEASWDTYRSSWMEYLQLTGKHRFPGDLRGLDRDAIMREIGRSITQHRKTAGLSQAELAERLGLDQPSVSRWERGERAPGADMLALIAYALDIDEPGDLLSDALDAIRDMT